MLVQGASRCGVPCPECSGVCEGLAAACHTRSVVGGMARSLSTPFSAVIMPGCAHGGCLWSHCQVIVTCLTLSGHWQDMLTGKHDLLCKQLLTSCLDQATSRYKRPRRPQTLPYQATALQDHIQALHTTCSIHSLSSPPEAFMGRHFMPLSTTTAAHSGAAGTPGNTNLSTAVRFPNAHLSAHCCGDGDAAVLPLLLDDSDYLATHPSCIQGSKPGYRAQRPAPRKHRPVSQCGSLISCCSGQGVCSYHDHQVHRCSPGRPLTRGPRAAGRATSMSWLRHC
jgi:hypothetical protein